MTTPLAEILATLPSGRKMPNLSNEALENYLRVNYITKANEKTRRLRHRKRLELFKDGGLQYIEQLIDDTYTKESVKQRLKAWAAVARFDNPLKRIVREISTVYQKPAMRTVADVDSNERYQKLQKACRQAERSRQINKLLNVHRSLFVGFRIREFDRKPMIDIITPDQCFAVTHPNDSTLLIALIIEVSFRTAVNSHNAPAYVVWTEHESFHLTKDARIVKGSYEAHGFGRIPYVHVSLEPAIDDFWCGEDGEDLVGATLSAWFANTNLMKETKSAAKFPVVAGDTSNSARDQAADSDEVIEVPEGTSINTIDTSMDLDLFQGTSDHVVEHAGNNYGLSGAAMKHQGVQSAEARELMLAPVKAIRDEQLVPITEYEEEFVVVQSVVCRVEGHELAFDPAGFKIKYADNKTPLEPKKRLEVFEHERRLGLTNTIAFLMETQGLTEEQAWDVVVDSIVIEVFRNVLMRPLQAISGSPGAETPPNPDGSPAPPAPTPGPKPEPAAA